MNEFKESNAILLRKVDYSNTSLIITVFTRDFGKLAFILPGARNLKKNKYLQVDFFREMLISFNDNSSKELLKLTSCHCIKNYANIASDFNAYTLALWLCKFTELNSVSYSQKVLFYNTILKFFDIYSGINKMNKVTLYSYLLGAVFIFLKEEGLIGEESLSEKYKRMSIFTDLYSKKDAKTPEFNKEKWCQIITWLPSFIEYFNLKYPLKPDIKKILLPKS